MNDQFDLLAALEARDDGIAQVIETGGTWHDRAVRLAKDLLPKGWHGLGEDLRRILIASDRIEAPHHPNAWGAVAQSLIKDGVLRATGEWRRPTAKKSKGRPCQVYRRAA